MSTTHEILIQKAIHDMNRLFDDDEKEVKIFSYCLFGNHKKYTLGMLDNAQKLQRDFPDYQVWIFCSSNISPEYRSQFNVYTNVKWIMMDCHDGFLKCMRFLPLMNPKVSVGFVRDNDSRVELREKWCIEQFLSSSYRYHNIRDHFWHKARLMAGLFGWKNVWTSQQPVPNFHTELPDILLKWSTNHQATTYMTDAYFLEFFVYPSITASRDLQTHSSCVAFDGELDIFPIHFASGNQCDFVGNVFEYNPDNQAYPSFNNACFTPCSGIVEHISYLQRQRRPDMILCVFQDFVNRENFGQISSNERNSLLLVVNFSVMDVIGDFSKYNFPTHEYVRDTLFKVSQLYELTHITEAEIYNSTAILLMFRDKFGYQLVATTDASRKPRQNEIVIHYGAYGHHSRNLWTHVDQPILRHPMYMNQLKGDVHYEFESEWNAVEQIYILNLADRLDRWSDLLVELCHMGAPLNRIHRVIGEKNDITDDRLLNAYLGATESHLRAVQDMQANSYQHCLVLEDDFVFHANKTEMLKNLQTFFDRDYDYDVCMLGYSKFHNIQPHDDLLNLSFQECTTTSAYLLNLSTVEKVRICFQEGYDKMLQTRDYNKYVCDRYWAKLQANRKFFMFRQKFGYQRLTYSDIQKKVNYNFD